MIPDAPAPDDALWAGIRRRYETATESLAAIAQEVNLAPVQLSKRAKAWGWLLRSPPKKDKTAKQKAPARKPRSESTAGTIRRLKDLVYGRLAQLEGQLTAIGSEINQLSNEREIRAMNTLVRTLEKVLELENNDRNRKHKPALDARRFDEQQRQELADKIARLQQNWRSRDAGAELKGPGSDGAE